MVVLFLLMVACSSNKRTNIGASKSFEYSLNMTQVESDLSKLIIDTFVLVRISTWEGERISVNFMKNGIEYAALSEIRDNKNQIVTVYTSKSHLFEYVLSQYGAIEKYLSIPWSTNDTLIDEKGFEVIKEIPVFKNDPFVEVTLNWGEKELFKTYHSSYLPKIYYKDEPIWLLIVHALSASF